MGQRNITLKDVAKESKLSVSTISRVINNEKFVSVDTKEKVEKAIKKLVKIGYIESKTDKKNGDMIKLKS